jgi:broad specificity phosphatase PhoE
MPMVICRHGERTDYVTPGWTAAAARPWDPPLTPKGHEQAVLAGRQILNHLKRLHLPPIQQVFSSPLLRCASTAVQIAGQLGPALDVKIEPNLVETICENWYYSWAIPGADGTWGGPGGSQAPKEHFEDAALRAQATASAATLYLGPAELSSVSSVIDSGYRARSDLAAYRWGQYETEDQTARRVADFGAAQAAAHPGSTVLLVTHGGPSSLTVEHLTGVAEGTVPVVGYTGLHVLAEPAAAGGSWRALVTGDVSHLGDDPGALGASTAGRATVAKL